MFDYSIETDIKLFSRYSHVNLVLIQVGGKAKDARKYHFCPFLHCVKPLKKLSQHIQQIHPEVSENERNQGHKKARTESK